jgi:transcriptional regulator with XRE-family HTH domain
VGSQEHAETLAQLIARLRDHYDVTDSDIARAIDVSPATVNAWANGTRGGGRRGPNPKKLRALAAAYPHFTEDEIFAAVNASRAPGPLTPEAKQRLLDLFDRLTEEQREMFETQVRAVADRNHPGSS